MRSIIRGPFLDRTPHGFRLALARALRAQNKSMPAKPAVRAWPE
jgi:hypothetical protein